MAPRITLPGGGAIDLDVQEARILNVGLVTADDTFTPEQAAGVAVPRSYVDRGDIAFYDATTTYTANQYVLFNNRIWFANRSVTGVEPGTSADDWSEISRPDLFLTITAEDANVIMADNRDHNVTITGGTGIDTTADSTTDTLTIDLNAVLDNLTDVSAGSPQEDQFLQWNGSAWAPADVTGDGFSIISDGTNTAEVSAARQTIEFSGTGPVAAAVTSDQDSANVAISVAEATTSQEGLLSSADKTLLDDVRDGGYSNADLVLGRVVSTPTLNPQVTLSDSTGQLSNVFLNGLMDLTDLNNIEQGLRDRDVTIYSDLPALTADLVADRPYNVYVLTRMLTTSASASPAINDRNRWYIDGQRPTTVTGPTSIGINSVAQFTLTFNALVLENVGNNNDHTHLLIALDDDDTDFNNLNAKWVVPPGSSVGDLDDLSDVNVASATQGQVLTRQADGTWTGVNPADIEDHGGRIWNSVVNYEPGDIVSFTISGSRRLFIALRANTNVMPAAGGNDDWQEASILRLRDIANIEITDDPANNSFLIWNQAEEAWEVTSAFAIAGLMNLGQLADVNTTGAQEGNTLTYDVDAEGNATWNASGFTARQLLFSTDTTNVQYHRGELVYTTNDVAYPTNHRDQIYRVNSTFNAPTAAVGFDPFPAGLTYLGERDVVDVVTDDDVNVNPFNEITSIQVGSDVRPIRQNIKSGTGFPPNEEVTAGDAFVLIGSGGLHTDTFTATAGEEQFAATLESSNQTGNFDGVVVTVNGDVVAPGTPGPNLYGIGQIGTDLNRYDIRFAVGRAAGDIITITYPVGSSGQEGIYHRNQTNTHWIKDDRTYTFTDGTNGTFTVTDSNGTETRVSTGDSGIPTGDTLPSSAEPGEGFILIGGGSHTDTFTTTTATQEEFTATMATSTPPSADPIEDFLTVTLDGNTIAPTDATNPYQISVIPNILGPGHNAFAIQFNTALASGRTVTLTYAIDDVESNGYYYRNGANTAWVKDDNFTEYAFGTTQSGTGVQLQITETPNIGNPSVESITFSAGDGITLTAGNDEVTIASTHNEAHPLREWSSTVTYAARDQVLRDGGSNVNSIYVARRATTNEAPESHTGGSDPAWYLVRSGIVALSLNNGSALGLTGNATLGLQQGSGTSIALGLNAQGHETYTITAHGTGHTDPSDFGPGYAYAYINLVDNHLYQGVVTAAFATNLTVTAIDGDRNRVGLVVNAGSSHANALGAFATESTNVGSFFPGRTDNRIIYGQFDETGNVFDVLQVEPSVSTFAELQSIFGVSNTVNRGSLNITGINLLGLEEGSGTATNVYQWALLNNTDQIDANKFEALSQDPPSTWVNGDAFARINDGWLPDDVPLEQSVTVTRSSDATAAETLAIDSTGALSLTLDPHSDSIAEATDVTLTDLAGDQILQYNADTSMWTNVDLPQSSRFRFSTTTEASSNVEITGYITDNDLDAGTFTTVRSANFSGTGGRLRFELARYMSQLGTFADFAGRPDWDEPWSDQTTGNTITIGVQSEDDLFPAEHLQTLATTEANITITGNPRSRGTGNRWTVAHTDRSLVLSNGTGLTGGTNTGGEFTVTATTNTGDNMSTSNMGGGVLWNNASLTTSGRSFGTRQTFLNSYPNYTWTLRTNGISNTNSCELDFDNSSFRSSANTTFGGAGLPAGTTLTGRSSLNIGGAGTVTFTSTGPFWNNGAALANDDILHEFHRPEGVTGTAYTVDNRVSQGSGQPVFTYPVFHLSSSDGTTVPNFLNGTQANTGNTNKSASFRLGNTGFSLDNRGGAATRYLWVAYPAASPAVTQIVVTTVASSGATATNTITLSDVQRSSTNVSLRGSGAPASAAEDYRWFWIEVPAGDNVTLGQATQ